ncbi:Phosphoserine phosphatase [Pyrenophora teres f. maculata]|nr:Phosphoserine phosphatase [Pyrenophora teres f. maculata]
MSQGCDFELQPRLVFFTDFDGTITRKDSNDLPSSNLGFGEAMLKASDLAVLEGRKSFRDSFIEQMHSIDGTLEECAEYQCKHADLDPGFAKFFKWAKASGVRVIVLSAGLEPLIRALIGHLLGTEAAAELQIISNEAVSWQDPCGNTRRNWQVKLHDSTEFGMDKSIHIQAYAKRLGHVPKNKRPTLLFAGDGVSVQLVCGKVGRRTLRKGG